MIINNPTEKQLKELKGIVYLITNSINNKVYVGVTIHSFYNRYHGGKWYKWTTSEYLINAIKKYGYENFTLSILEFGITDEQKLNKLEEYYSSIYNSVVPNGYNMKKCGGKHATHSDISRWKSKKTKQDNPQVPYKRTTEIRKKISESLKETYKKTQHPWVGRKHKPESIEKSRQTKSKTYEFILNGDLITIVNLRKFCRDNCLNFSCMWNVANDKEGYYKGYTKPNSKFVYKTKPKH